MSDPSDWTEATDKKTGKTYYYNKKTKKTQWSKPEELGGGAAKAGGAVAAAKKKGSDSDASDKGSDDEGAGGAAGGVDPQDDPKNWSKTKDKKTGKEYYYNKVTKKTSWKKPACLPASDDDEEEPAAKKPAAAAAAKEEPAAAAADAGDWKETVDKKTGKKYWYNKVTKKTTWKDPTKAADEGSDDGAKKKKKGSDDDSGDDDASDAGSEDDVKAKPAAAAATKKAAGSDDDEEEEEKGTKAESEDDESVLARQKKESDPEEDNKAEEEEEDDDDPNKSKAPELQGADSDEGEGEEGEEGDDQNHEFRFAKHRKGWFNRTFRVGPVHDDASILTFKKSLIKKALLKQNRDLDQEAVQAFKNVMSYMGDRKSSKPPIEHAKKMLKNLMVAPAGLRDEVYMQLCKQTTRNPRVSSTIKGWELMSYCLATFPPSKHLKGFLTDFIKKTVKEAKDDKVRELAEVCAQRVPKILKMGQRKQVPSRMELECLKDVKPVPIRVSLVNGTFKSFNVDPYTLVKEVQDQLVEKYNLVVTKPFAMYEAAEANVERILDPKDRVLDVQASWENKPREEAGEEEGAAGKKGRKTTYDKHKDAGKKVTVRTANFNRFLYKAKLVLKTTNQEIMSDPEAINLIYIQATHDVVTSRYPVNEKDITVLAALQLQATFGDFKRDVHLAGWLAPKIEEFMPKTLLEKKGKKSDKLLKEWEQKILAKYAKVSGFTSLEAKLNYLDYVQEWTFYGSTFFIVEQRQFKDYPSPLTLGINCEGVILMHPEKQTVLENYGFTDIVTWGHSDEKFIVVVGNIVQQRKLIFKTQEGKAMNHLIHDYVKFKVKNK